MTEETGLLKKTILHDAHVALGAKMAPFGGYDMPIQYSGIMKEHAAARENAVIFDTCHMGEFSIRGESAEADLEKILSCRVDSLRLGHCRYGFLCNENGGVIDDQIIYRMKPSEFFMVVNASTKENDAEWIRSHLSPATTFDNLSQKTAKLDLQGPGSVKIMTKLLALPFDRMTYYTWAWNRYRNKDVLISRTGYTGEIGFEIYTSHELGIAFWNDSLELGALPAGLGARDTLRLEMGFPLYGHELDDKTNAAESGFSRAIATDKTFIGSKAVLDENALKQRLAGIMIEGRRAARNGDTICGADGAVIGRVTSGSFAPSLGYAVAIGYVAGGYVAGGSSAIGTPVKIKTERNELSGAVVHMPFYTKATARADINLFL
ncbi:MAG: glycine cleavage system aminomethyltransferase GcvT [Chitinispirillaceae bacterium]|jgi:aminomethyltransferase|nr:glycine cleavage system aminomethyltransferase GcvT [Chitinispirillaceae bacterium]